MTVDDLIAALQALPPEQRPEAVGDMVRALLLALPQGDRAEALHATALCLRCGADELERRCCCDPAYDE